MSFRQLPVVDEHGRLVGIITRRDVLRILHRTDAETTVAVRAALADPSRCRPDHDVTASTDAGTVTLAGSAATAADVEHVIAVVRDVAGVLDVRDDIVRAPSVISADA